VSPEEADYGIVELWQNRRLIAMTAVVDSRTVVRFEAAPDGAPIEIGARVLHDALAEAKQQLSEF